MADKRRGDKAEEIAFKYRPKAGDGTQDKPLKKPEGNWFGPSTEPQEEFIDDGIGEDIRPHPDKGGSKPGG